MIEFYRNFSKNSEIAQRKMAEISLDERLNFIDHELIFSGTGGIKSCRETFLYWWLWRANRVGIAQANADFDAYASNQSIKYYIDFYVKGIEIESTINIDNLISISPIEHIPDNDVKQFVLSEEKGILSLKKSIAVISYKIDAPKFYSSAFPNNQNIYPDEFHWFINLIGLVSRSPLIVARRTGRSAENVPPGPFVTASGLGPSTDINIVYHRKITEFNKVKFLFLRDRIKEIKKDTDLNKILFSLRLFSEAMARMKRSDQIVNLVTCLEPLLCKSRNQTSELFCKRGANLISKSKTEYEYIYKLLKSVYNDRNDYVHGRVIDSPVGPPFGFQENTSKGFETGALIIEAIIAGGIPTDWGKAMNFHHVPDN